MKEPEDRDYRVDAADEIRAALKALGYVLGVQSDAGLKETPERIARFWAEFHQPVDLVDLVKNFPNEGDGLGMPMVIQSRIPLAGLCEHHFAPFFGHADIGYIPQKHVIGLSKIARLVEAAGRRSATIQERLTKDISVALHDGLEAGGVIVVTHATHTCMTCRGVRAYGTITSVSAIEGAYVHNPNARQEFFNVIAASKG